MALLGEDGPAQIDSLFENGPNMSLLDKAGFAPNRTPTRVEVVNTKPSAGARGEP
jgi:hypothetical protein